MKLSEIKNLKFDDLIWTVQYGFSKRKATILDLRSDNFNNIEKPVFFLSTGRCGTKWFANLLSLDKKLKVFHEPKPNLGVQGRVAWEVIMKKYFEISETEKELLGEIFLAGREQYLRYSYKSDRRYVETNNQITFFAPVLTDLFPDSLFVHVYRHPGEFVRSAIRRKFYKPGNIEDLKRIFPLQNSGTSKKWKKYSEIEKVSWLWTETNSFIEKVKDSIPKNRFFSFDFNKMNIENVSELSEFCGAKINKRKIGKLLGNKKNVQKTGSYSNFENWNDEQKQQLKNICGEMAAKYGYKL